MVIALSLVGCLKPSPPVHAANHAPVRVAVVLESYDTPTVELAPDPVQARIGDTLAARNLEPAPVDAAAVGNFAQARSTEARRGQLETDAVPVLLVECAPRFSAQVNGRYRWTVEVTASIGPEHPDARPFTVPVHLLYAHEQEEEAVIEAAPLVAREVGRLVDDWLGVSATPAR
jgi:hypothetical protein